MILLNTSKCSAKDRAAKGRNEASIHTLTLQDIERIHKEQNGLCYYTKIPYVLNRLSDWMCSLERKDPDKGYVKENVALVVCEMNGPSQWSPEKFETFVKKINIKHEKQDIDFSLQEIPTKPYKFLDRLTIDGVEHIKCSSFCGQMKPISDYHINLSHGCKECCAEKQRRTCATPRGHMVNLLGRMRDSHKRHNFSPCLLDLTFLINLFKSQGGLCAYSGIPMTFGSYRDRSWTCSPERLDITQGYTETNVVLICHKFNTPIRSTKEDTQGNSGWSKEKIETLKHYNPI